MAALQRCMRLVVQRARGATSRLLTSLLTRHITCELFVVPRQSLEIQHLRCAAHNRPALAPTAVHGAHGELGGWPICKVRDLGHCWPGALQGARAALLPRRAGGRRCLRHHRRVCGPRSAPHCPQVSCQYAFVLQLSIIETRYVRGIRPHSRVFESAPLPFPLFCRATSHVPACASASP